MRFDILTLFPSAFDDFRGTSILGRAIAAGHIQVEVHDIRAFSTNKHKKVDDVPYGGGAGMVMMCQPLYDGIMHVKGLVDDDAPVVYLTPQGERLHQRMVGGMVGLPSGRMILLCGHYEGVDMRIREMLVDAEVSIGDYVLTGGELAAQIVIDSVARLVPGVLGKEASHQEESFSTQLDGETEYPHYTRPAEFMGKAVPEVLLSGHHAKIEAWRKANQNRPPKSLFS